jgi:hypothetical protein
MAVFTAMCCLVVHLGRDTGGLFEAIEALRGDVEVERLSLGDALAVVSAAGRIRAAEAVAALDRRVTDPGQTGHPGADGDQDVLHGIASALLGRRPRTARPDMQGVVTRDRELSAKRFTRPASRAPEPAACAASVPATPDTSAASCRAFRERQRLHVDQRIQAL